MSRGAQVVASAVVPATELGDSRELLRRNRIPPSQTVSVGQLHMLALRAAEDCLASAALSDEDRASTAVLVGVTGNHSLQRRNALRVASGQAPAWGVHRADPEAAVDAGCEVFGAGPHDKIGEMASSVPSRIAIAHRLKGRVLALDAHETTGAFALWHARHCLRTEAESAALLVIVDEDETAAARTAWQVETGQSSAFQCGRAVAVLLRPEGEDPTAVGSPVLGEIELRRGMGRAAHAVPEPAELDAWLTGLAPATSEFVLRGDAFLSVAARSQTLASARHVTSGRQAAGSVRVTDAMLDVLDAARDCRTGSPALTLTASVTGTLAAVTLHRPDSATRSVCPPLDRTGVVVAGAGALFAGQRGLDAFRVLSQRGEPQFRDLDDRIPEQMRSDARIRLGRTYSVRGVSTTAPEAPDPVYSAALDTCREAVQRSASDLSGQGLVVVATPIGPSVGRLCDAGSEETAAALSRMGERLGAGRETVSEVLEWLTESAAKKGGSTPHTIEDLHAGSVAGFVIDELGLDAVPVAVEAACASTLAAVDVAVGALRAGEVDYALVCGVEFPTSCRDLVLCSALGMLSTTTLSAFGTAADGFLPGDGAGALVLVRSDTVDSEVPVSTILGSGGSCDARSMLAPSAGGQESAMSRALANAAVSPSDVDYIETHGTGTLRGDAIELESIRNAYGDGPITLGAVKSLLGHTFSAAGMAGMLRVITALEDGVAPPSAGVSEEDAQSLAADGFRIPPTPQPIRTSNRGTARAAVSAFGTGGINYHIVVDRSEI